MSATDVEHAVFQTSRHGDGGARVQIVGRFGTLGIVVPAAGHAEPMTEAQTVEALRNALVAMGEASERLKEHVGKLDPDGATRATLEKPEEPVPSDARSA